MLPIHLIARQHCITSQVICQTVLVNTYRRPACLIILGASDIYSLEDSTQGDNLAMAFYALETTPLVNTLQIASPEVRQVCLADDISGAGSLDNLIIWWQNLISEGKKFGYLVNEKKIWLILKDHGKLQETQHFFSNTIIKLTTDCQRHLGVAIFTFNFRAQYAAENVTKWCSELHRLADFAKTQPHAAYSAFTQGILSHYTYFMRAIPGMHEFIKTVDDLIRLELLPTLLNYILPEVDRQHYSILLRHGGLGIPLLSEMAESQFETLQAITLPLVTIIITQGNTLPNKTEVNEIKRKIKNEQEVRISERDSKVKQDQTPHTLKAIQQESLRLGVLPVAEFGFALNKGEFRDNLSLRYGRPLEGLPAMCLTVRKMAL